MDIITLIQVLVSGLLNAQEEFFAQCSGGVFRTFRSILNL